MNRLDAEVIDYYDNEVVSMMIEKYEMDQMKALKEFVCSRTHELLENADCGMTDFGASALLDMWECEKITGDPRNSVYIRGE